ncbi:MAG: hypothetical protein J0I79_14905 [Mesorhizobium sp.]|nr:hypothetical protein [Mesorhizobium sp.]MBN9219239.1 hypothetical protein [Mesorhizobium sp.]
MPQGAAEGRREIRLPHKGDTMKALKEMIVLNGYLQDELDEIKGRKPRRS